MVTSSAITSGRSVPNPCSGPTISSDAEFQAAKTRQTATPLSNVTAFGKGRAAVVGLQRRPSWKEVVTGLKLDAPDKISALERASNIDVAVKALKKSIADQPIPALQTKSKAEKEGIIAGLEAERAAIGHGLKPLPPINYDWPASAYDPFTDQHSSFTARLENVNNTRFVSDPPSINRHLEAVRSAQEISKRWFPTELNCTYENRAQVSYALDGREKICKNLLETIR